jgi:cation diffusion facilitator family transporter
VAAFGLLINLISALLLQDHHGHEHARQSHQHKPDNKHKPPRHHDHNLKAAYFHVLADALTSVLAISALLFGKYYGWLWLDPAMGITGALVIIYWAWGLLKETSPVLLDESIALEHKQAIINLIESDADNRISDLHVWRVAPDHFAIIIALVSHTPKSPEYYKNLLTEFYRHSGINLLSHITIEVNHCSGENCLNSTTH